MRYGSGKDRHEQRAAIYGPGLLPAPRSENSAVAAVWAPAQRWGRALYRLTTAWCLFGIGCDASLVLLLLVGMVLVLLFIGGVLWAVCPHLYDSVAYDQQNNSRGASVPSCGRSTHLYPFTLHWILQQAAC